MHPFCNKVKLDPLQTECTEDRASVALCNLVEHAAELPFQYRNFERIPNVPEGEVARFGGSVVLADYCPYIQEFTWKSQNKFVRGSHCLYEDNNPGKLFFFLFFFLSFNQKDGFLFSILISF